MKLVSLYSNKAKIFPPIRFRDGFNVVFAKVKEPFLQGHDAHNLGKTFLIQVIDFALLAKVRAEHPFKLHPDLFSEFEFFLEIETNSRDFVTIKRKVSGRQGINIYISSESRESLIDLPDSQWNYSALGVDKAQEILNDLVALSAIKPYTYRKGLGYFLRSQSDYIDEFELERFQRGKDLDWKPFLALILGYDYEILKQKYDLDEKIAERDAYRQSLESEAGSKSEKYDEIRGIIELREVEAERLRKDLDKFSFHEMEAQINEHVVSEIESQIAKLNNHLYTINYELQEIDRSLTFGLEFNIDEIRRIFEEVKLNLPDSLTKEYTELIDFNRRLSAERTKRLQEIQNNLVSQKQEILNALVTLDAERQEALAFLREKETLAKYRELQKRLLKYEENILQLKQQLMYLDRAASVKNEIADLQVQLVDAETKVQELLRSGNQTYREIRKTFAEYVNSVLNIQALLLVTTNQSGNFEFRTRTIDREIAGRETNESEGTSYKKLLCACFDLAILKTYTDKSFYRFVYHDGIFEGLDNRIKVRLLKLVRDICASGKIQYILTVIDTDLPRDELDKKLLFTEDEIIRELSDDGEAGRLFRMRTF